jgi:HAE1 family hydrophobic/amphiphilic exporter-1
LALGAIGAFVALAVAGGTLDLSALIGPLMLIGIVIINATVLREITQHKIHQVA